jgi:hypothetical protein
MPTGPEGQKRPADVIGNAIKVARIATGEDTEETVVDDGKDPHAKALGTKGGAARVKAMTAEQRTEIARVAATALRRQFDAGDIAGGGRVHKHGREALG